MIEASGIRQVRERLGESQAIFGARFGVDQSTVHRWETDGLPDKGAARFAIEQFVASLPREAAPQPESAAS